MKALSGAGSTVKPLNNGHSGAGLLSIIERLFLSRRLTSWPQAESANLDQVRSERTKIDKQKEWTDYLSEKYPKFDLIPQFWSPSTLGGYLGTLAVHCLE